MAGNTKSIDVRFYLYDFYLRDQKQKEEEASRPEEMK